MFNMPSLKLGTIFGIPVEVNASWLVVFALLVFGLSTSIFAQVEPAAAAPLWLRLLVAVIAALLFFASILAHELSHSLVVRAQGGRVDGITLFMFGGVSRMEDEPGTPGREFLMAIAGPAMSVLLSFLFGALFSLSRLAVSPWWISVPLQYLAGVNFFVAIFNLLPGFPLDGGRVLRSVLWSMSHDLLKATKWASRAGQAIGSLMVGVAFVGVLRGVTDFIWIGLVGWFLASLASSSYQQQIIKSRLDAVNARSIMSRDPQTVPGESTLDSLVHDYFLGGPHSRYPVLHRGQVVGLITLDDVKAVNRAEWPLTMTVDIAQKDLSNLVVDVETPAAELARRLSAGRPGALLISDRGLLAGIVTRADVIEMMQDAARQE